MLRNLPGETSTKGAMVAPAAPSIIKLSTGEAVVVSISTVIEFSPEFLTDSLIPEGTSAGLPKWITFVLQ